jgi:hypothetical protein
MELSYLLSEANLDTKRVRVLVMRHVPSEPEFRKMLPWLAAERPDIYNAYQQSQHPHVQKQMTSAEYVVSCIGHKPREALFIGLYKLNGQSTLTFDDFWRIPANQELGKLGRKDG